MRCITLLDDKDASFHLDRKKVIFSHAYRGSSRSLHGVTTHVKPPGFKQLNWRIRENLSQAINNGSWYKLSLLVSEDAMIVPATFIYSVWRLAQNSWDMSPWNEHHYFQFYKLGVGKVINRLNLSCTPLKTAVQNFQAFCSNHEARFGENWFGRGWEEWWMSRGDTKTSVTPPRGFKTMSKCPPYGQFQIFVFLKKLKIASLCMDNSRES